MSIFSRQTCDACDRRFFGKGTALRRFDNSPITVCSDACVALEKRRREEAYEAFKAAGRAKHDAWAVGVRASIAAGGWHHITLAPGTTETTARVGGPAPAVAIDRWPAQDGQPALHVCTLPGPALGLDAGALSVFMHVELDASGRLHPVPAGGVVAVSSDEASRMGPPSDARSPLRSASVILTPATSNWDPTVRDATRSFVGSISITFEGEAMDMAWPIDEEERRGYGRFVAQLEGAALPWTDDASELFREIAAIHVFERGAAYTFYG